MNFSNKDIIHVKEENGIEYIKFKILEEYEDKLSHAFFTKLGGVSKGIYSSLNVRQVSYENKEDVIKNIQIIANTLNIEVSDIYKASQKHTDNILFLDNNNKEKYGILKINKEEFDGYVTNEKNVATMVTTADCNPLIIYDKSKNIVANVHSGWNGTVKKIYLKTVQEMIQKYGSKKEDIIVCIGPSILKCCWNSEDVILKEQFVKIWNFENEYILKEEGNKRYSVNFPFVIKKDLIDFGLKEENIVLSNICTCCNEEYFYSYRRATRNKEVDYATQATIAFLK